MDSAQKKLGSARPAAVLAVSAWALGTAFVLLLCYVLEYATTCAPTLVHVIDIGILWCAPLQAAAAVLALRPPCRRVRVRCAFAYLALAITIVGHCMLASKARLSVVAHPGDLFLGITCTASIFICAVADITCATLLWLVGQRSRAGSTYVADWFI